MVYLNLNNHMIDLLLSLIVLCTSIVSYPINYGLKEVYQKRSKKYCALRNAHIIVCLVVARNWIFNTSGTHSKCYKTIGFGIFLAKTHVSYTSFCYLILCFQVSR